MTSLELRLLIFIVINVALVLFRNPLAALVVQIDRTISQMIRVHSKRPLITNENAVFCFFWSGVINSIVSLLAFPAIRVFELDKLLILN